MTEPEIILGGYTYVTGKSLDGVIQNMPYDLGDGLSRTLVNLAEEGNEPSIWWLYVYQDRAADGRKFAVRCSMTPEFVDDYGPERVRALVIEEWQVALDRALGES